MPAFKRVSINGPQFFETIVQPGFGDYIQDSDVQNGFYGEFRVYNDVPDSKKIIDITPIRNIVKRRDASCKITYSPVGSADVRRISVTDLYGATEFCRQEFYQGCLKDWRNGDPVFIDKIFEFFKKAIREDMLSLMYFGDVSRVDAAGAAWNTDKFDGVYTQLLKYVSDGTIPSAQTFNVPDAAISAANSKVYLQNMLDKQDELLGDVLQDGEKAFYIDKQWADAYEDYLIGIGSTTDAGVNFTQDGIKVRAYKGIPIFVNTLFKPVLKQITGHTNPHLGILTLRGNFLFATDKNYGEGPNGDQALIVRYDWDSLEWKYQNFFKAGTGIALPQHTVLALPA